MLNISWMTGFSEKRLVVAFLILTAAIVVDWVLGTIADLVIDFAISIWGVVLFTILASIYILGQYYVFTLVKSKNSETVSKKTHFKGLERVVSVTQHILAALIF